jgi:hypothetical protein
MKLKCKYLPLKGEIFQHLFSLGATRKLQAVYVAKQSLSCLPWNACPQILTIWGTYK